MYNGTLATFTNQTLLNDTDLCTLDTCPLEIANFTYVPNLAGNVLYLALFVIFLCGQVGLGFWYRTWGFLVGMVSGLLLEIIGYVGRVQLHFNPFPFNPFLEYLVCLTIAPAFLSFSIYTTLGRIITIYGSEASRLKPRTYTIIFVTCDFFSLVLQALGGALTATADKGDKKAHDLGVNIMIAGLAAQVVSLIVFMALTVDLWFCITRTRKEKLDYSEHELVALREGKRWQLFLYALAVATIAIFIRSVFRCVELAGGFDGAVANNEPLFMVFEGMMIVIACAALTIFHPGLCFAGQWARGAWSFRTKKGAKAAGPDGVSLNKYGTEYRGVHSDEESLR